MKNSARALLGAATGASFGLVVGALIASWVIGPTAGNTDIAEATIMSIAIASVGGAVGAVIGWRAP